MNDFLRTALTFPTLVYSVLLAVCAAFWLLAATGLADLDGADVVADGGDPGGADSLAAWLGVPGVPVMVVGTTLVLVAWLCSYFAQLLVLRHLPDGVRGVAGAAVMAGALVPAAAATAVLLRPVSRGLARVRPPSDAAIIGRTGVVITPARSAELGRVAVEDGGAGLILQVRHDGALERGDRVVLVEYMEGEHAYRVVPEQQFLGR